MKENWVAFESFESFNYKNYSSDYLNLLRDVQVL